MKRNILKIEILMFFSVFGLFVLNCDNSLCFVSAYENQNNIIFRQGDGLSYENNDFELNDKVIVCDYEPLIDDNTSSGNTLLNKEEGEADVCNYPPVIDDNTPSGNTPLNKGEGEADVCDYPPVIDDDTPSGNTPLKIDINAQRS